MKKSSLAFSGGTYVGSCLREYILSPMRVFPWLGRRAVIFSILATVIIRPSIARSSEGAYELLTFQTVEAVAEPNMNPVSAATLAGTPQPIHAPARVSPFVYGCGRD